MTGDCGSPVPPYRAQVRWVVDAGALDASAVRNAALATMRNWGAYVLADDVALIVGELAANAWGRRQPPIAVMLRFEEASILIEVSDTEPGVIVFSMPEPLRAHGRGGRCPGGGGAGRGLARSGRVGRRAVRAAGQDGSVSTGHSVRRR
jgi:hypothetical protein